VLCSTEFSSFPHETAGAGSSNVDDATVMLAVQLRGAGVVESAGNDGTRRWWSRLVACVLVVEYTPISRPFVLGSARVRYEYAGDDDAVLGVYS